MTWKGAAGVGVSGVPGPAEVRAAGPRAPTAPPRGRVGRVPCERSAGSPGGSGASGGRGRRAADERAERRPPPRSRARPSERRRPRARAQERERRRGRVVPARVWTPAVASPVATCCAAPRPAAGSRRAAGSIRAGAALPPPVQVPATETWVGRGARGPRTGGAEAWAGAARAGVAPRRPAGCGEAQGSATPPGAPRTAEGTPSSRPPLGQRGAPPGEVSRARSQSFPLLTLLDLTLTCEANPGK